MQADPHYWVELLYLALRGLQHNGINLMIWDAIPSGIHLAKQVNQAIKFLSGLHPEEPYKKFYIDLQKLGIEPGWGNTAEYHDQAWQKLADEEGIPFKRKANEALRGVSRRASLMLVIGDRA